MIKLGAKELRITEAQEEQKKILKKNSIYIIVDNVLDTYNVGAIFRLADAVAVEKVYLCGQTETPPNSRIKKASINTTEWVNWEYASSAVEAIKKVREEFSTSLEPYASSEAEPNREVMVVAIEQSEKSVPYDTIAYQFPVALIVGHETDGVTQEAMDASDVIAEMPMWGVNKSLNVMVSLGIVLYEVAKRLK
jgi:23S rRNA (guanosine2251-2'-O)-methyltransferase